MALGLKIDPILEDIIAQVYRGAHEGPGPARIRDVDPNFSRVIAPQVDDANATLLDAMQGGDPYEYGSRIRPLTRRALSTSLDPTFIRGEDIKDLQPGDYFTHSHPGTAYIEDLDAMLADPISHGDSMFALSRDLSGVGAVDEGGGVSSLRFRPSQATMQLRRAINKKGVKIVNDLNTLAAEVSEKLPDIHVTTPGNARERQSVGYNASGLGTAIALKRLGIINDVGYRAGNRLQERTIPAAKEHIRASAASSEDYFRRLLGMLAALGSISPALEQTDGGTSAPLQESAL